MPTLTALPISFSLFSKPMISSMSASIPLSTILNISSLLTSITSGPLPAANSAYILFLSVSPLASAKETDIFLLSILACVIAAFSRLESPSKSAISIALSLTISLSEVLTIHSPEPSLNLIYGLALHQSISKLLLL